MTITAGLARAIRSAATSEATRGALRCLVSCTLAAASSHLQLTGRAARRCS